MSCPSLELCATEQHPRSPCRDCGARVCELSMEHGRCLACIARRLRRARIEGRLDAYGQPATPDATEARPDGYRWGEAWRELQEAPAVTRGGGKVARNGAGRREGAA